LYDSPNITGAIKSRRMRLAEHVAFKAHMPNPYKILVQKPKGKRLPV